MTSTRVDPATIRLRGIAAILARGVQRLRHSAGVPADDPTVSKNLADSLPERLEIVAKPSLSVSHHVSDPVGRDEISIPSNP